MPSIVEYTDRKAAANHYPARIVSPSQSSDCCFSRMAELGEEHTEGRWVYRYRRCAACGYTVRVIVRTLPDTDLIAQLQKIMATALTRNVPAF